MNKGNVLTLVRWLRRTENVTYRYQEITLENLFAAAYVNYYGGVGKDSSTRLQCDLHDFEKHGYLPIYVVGFVKHTVYPLLKGGNHAVRLLPNM